MRIRPSRLNRTLSPLLVPPRPGPALVALAVHGLVDGDAHGAEGAGQPHAVGVEAVAQGDLALAVGGLAAAVALLYIIYV